MFDIGFAELLLIGVIALLVLGPERLPHAARMAGAWMGKIRRSFVEIQAQIEQEVHAEELRKRIQEEMDKSGLKELENELKDGVKEAETAGQEMQSELSKDLGLEGFSEAEKKAIEDSHRDFAEEMAEELAANSNSIAPPTEQNQNEEANQAAETEGEQSSEVTAGKPSPAEIEEATSQPGVPEHLSAEAASELQSTLEQNSLNTNNATNSNTGAAGQNS